jgi:hypothetical protein
MTIQYHDPRAVELREWLNDRHTLARRKRAIFLPSPCNANTLSKSRDKQRDRGPGQFGGTKYPPKCCPVCPG